MAERTLRGCRVLVVEDEYFIADEVRGELAEAGADVVGMAGTVGEALRLIQSCGPLDGAILDVNLGGEAAFPVAEKLDELGVPFLFATGYDAAAVPPRFRRVARCQKPVDIHNVAQAIGRLDDA